MEWVVTDKDTQNVVHVTATHSEAEEFARSLNGRYGYRYAITSRFTLLQEYIELIGGASACPAPDDSRPGITYKMWLVGHSPRKKPTDAIDWAEWVIEGLAMRQMVADRVYRAEHDPKLEAAQ